MDSDTSPPTGQWIGFHDCPEHGRIWERVNLSFAGAQISGRTYCGEKLLLIRGAFETVTRRCSFTMDCKNDNIDTFDGLWDGQRIAGAWRCDEFSCAGPFQLWPYRDGGGARREEFAEEAQEPWVSSEQEMDSVVQPQVGKRGRKATP